MKRARLVSLAAVIAALVACDPPASRAPASATATVDPPKSTSSALPTSEPTTSSSPSGTSSSNAASDPEAPYRCKTKDDCRSSCASGAVNKAWYEANHPPECKDGCDEGTSRVECEPASPSSPEKICVAYSGTKRNDECTHRAIRKRF